MKTYSPKNSQKPAITASLENCSLKNSQKLTTTASLKCYSPKNSQKFAIRASLESYSPKNSQKITRTTFENLLTKKFAKYLILQFHANFNYSPRNSQNVTIEFLWIFWWVISTVVVVMVRFCEFFGE